MRYFPEILRLLDAADPPAPLRDGAELLRSNMPAGPVGFDTLAAEFPPSEQEQVPHELQLDAALRATGPLDHAARMARAEWKRAFGSCASPRKSASISSGSASGRCC